MYAAELSDSPIGEQQDGPLDQPPERQSRLRHWTWKFSSRIGYSYAATLPRRHHDQRRKPIPFQPRSSAESGVPLHPCSSTAGLLKESSSDPEPVLKPLTHETIRESASEVNDEPSPYDYQDSHALVSPHPRHPVWDDEPNSNTPYDNPYYTRQISDSLWLPRDPLGLLDLDDTVDVRISITSEPGAGRLGPWPEGEFIGSVLSSVFAASFGSIEDDSSSVHQSESVELHGNEVINLPAGIASRVESVGREQVMEASSHMRPSLLGPRRSSNSGARSVHLRRQSSGHDLPTSGFQPFAVRSVASLQRPPSSHVSFPVPRHRSTSVSALGFGLPSERRTTSQLQPPSAGFRSSRRSNSIPRSPGVGSVISTREALVGEAIAEEQVVAEERLRQEEAERQRAKESRSWLTSWMYSSPR